MDQRTNGVLAKVGQRLRLPRRRWRGRLYITNVNRNSIVNENASVDMQ